VSHRRKLNINAAQRHSTCLREQLVGALLGLDGGVGARSRGSERGTQLRRVKRFAARLLQRLIQLLQRLRVTRSVCIVKRLCRRNRRDATTRLRVASASIALLRVDVCLRRSLCAR